MVRGAVRVVTGGASLGDRRMHDRLRRALRLVARAASLHLAADRRPIAGVRVVATRARHRAFSDGVVRGQTEARGDVGMAGSAHRGHAVDPFPAPLERRRRSRRVHRVAARTGDRLLGVLAERPFAFHRSPVARHCAARRPADVALLRCLHMGGSARMTGLAVTVMSWRRVSFALSWHVRHMSAGTPWPTAGTAVSDAGPARPALVARTEHCAEPACDQKSESDNAGRSRAHDHRFPIFREQVVHSLPLVCFSVCRYATSASTSAFARAE